MALLKKVRGRCRRVETSAPTNFLPGFAQRLEGAPVSTASIRFEFLQQAWSATTQRPS